MNRVFHEFDAFYCQDAKILILGSFPSVKSREVSFYYGHPQNRFWKVLAYCFDEEVPLNIEEKKELLCKHHIALWDVIDSCVITGSSDASIQEVILCDLNRIMKECPIEMIVLNGKTASKYFQRPDHFEGKIVVLPSTSSANAQYSLDRLMAKWKVIVE